ncbi:hypothetical protein C0U44_28530, partial [Klebsiella pneumoniae]
GDIYTILGTTCCTGIVCRGPQTVNEATRFVTHTRSRTGWAAARSTKGISTRSSAPPAAPGSSAAARRR